MGGTLEELLGVKPSGKGIAAHDLMQFLASTGQKIWALPNMGFPIWVRIKLSVLQTKTLYLGAKG